MYRKTYKGLIIGVLAYAVLIMALPFALPDLDADSCTRLIMCLTAIGMAALTYAIWRTEYVYWYNGTTFEDAEKAGSERRKAYALSHFRLFGTFAVAALVYTAIACLLNLPWWVDMTLVGGGLIVCAFWSMKYKL